MELFESESFNSDSGENPKFRERTDAEKSAMIEEFSKIVSDDSAELKDFVERWAATDSELLALNTAIDVGRVLRVWEGVENPDNMSAEETNRVETNIVNLFDDMSPERVVGTIVVLSLYAFKFVKSSLGG